jgi:uncharacterized protein
MRLSKYLSFSSFRSKKNDLFRMIGVTSKALSLALAALATLAALASCRAQGQGSAPVRVEPATTSQLGALSSQRTSFDTVDASGAACIGPGALPPRADAKNVRGAQLSACPSKHLTGFNRNGYCNTGPSDHGVHVVCAQVSEAFLNFSRAQGNDLIMPSASFPGLKPGDGWCLCASRWAEAFAAGVAPNVYSEATDLRALDFIDAKALQSRSIDLPSAPAAGRESF